MELQKCLLVAYFLIISLLVHLGTGTGIFFGTENRNRIKLYHLQNTAEFFRSLDMKPDTSNPNKWNRKFRSFQ